MKRNPHNFQQRKHQREGKTQTEYREKGARRREK